ncbi:MAG: TIGR03862 family flavoprotein [Hyphomonadaceae bacterium]|nr:TIGR03862 family flavoprotein [Hyphomonadaceae bacterium]
MSDATPIAIIGAGPAGLIAADVLSAAGRRVVVCERMPSVARKFLMAGRGGLNLTHSEPFEHFLTRYGETAPRLKPILEAFTQDDLIAWANALGAQTFIGSSGRVFPKAMKASPLLRAWLQRLNKQGVEIVTRAAWTGWTEDGALQFANRTPIYASQTLLALGGASWPRLGSDGSWRDILVARGVGVAPFRPSNVGFNVAWSEYIRRFAGEPLKSIAIQHGERVVRGEAMITEYGIEGGAIYALSAELREQAPVTIHVDLRPALSVTEIAAKLECTRASDSLSTRLRKALGLTPLALALVYEGGPPPREPAALAARVKAIPVRLEGPRGLDRAISSAGGIEWKSLTENLELEAIPGTFAAGEMLDWEAPTGGYLLQASFATGVYAARAMLGRAPALAASPLH